MFFTETSLLKRYKGCGYCFFTVFLLPFQGAGTGYRGTAETYQCFTTVSSCLYTLKPMGLSIDGLVSMAESFTAGGIDLIKDDHGITDQEFHRFEERVTRCADAVERVNSSTGGNTLYFPCVSGTFDTVEKQVQLAVSRGLKGYS
jgi:ribulose 1,5-bisphosphate carboxylase large subunit-like protein